MEVKFWDFKLAERVTQVMKRPKGVQLKEKTIKKDPFKDLKTATISRRGRETDEGGWDSAVWEVSEN